MNVSENAVTRCLSQKRKGLWGNGKGHNSSRHEGRPRQLRVGEKPNLPTLSHSSLLCFFFPSFFVGLIFDELMRQD